MPAKSPEALERKRLKLKAKRRAARQVTIQASPLLDATKRLMLRRAQPRLAADITKRDLRAMLAEAVRNTQ